MRKKLLTKMGSIIIICVLIITVLSPIAFSKDTKKNQDETKNKQKHALLQSLFQPKKRNSVTTQLPFLTSTIYTTCGSVEKTTEIMFGQFNEIDVDNNEQTGVNGKDISIQYIILPWLEMNPSLQIGLRFQITIQRIGDEIKSEAFSLSSNMFDGLMQLGYMSPQKTENEIPWFLELSSFVFLTPETGTSGISFEMDPLYETDNPNHQLTFFTTYANSQETQSYEFLFNPVGKKQITIESTKTNGLWQYHIQRQNTNPTSATIKIHRQSSEGPIKTNITIHSLPTDFLFNLAITPFSRGGGSIQYESNSYYDTSVVIESNNMGRCNYAIIQKMPKQLSIEWDPSKEQGYYHLSVDAQDSLIYLVDSLNSPTINLSISDIDVIEFSAFWNFTNPGDFTIVKDTSFHINLDFIIDVWQARIDAEPTAEYIQTTWLTDVTGYVSLDTNMAPLQTIDLLIKGSDLGIRTQGEYVSAQDFLLDWTIWPPIEWNIDTSGTIDFHSMDLEVFIEGIWYHLWPWF